MTENNDLLIVWNPFQRRAESLGAAFNLSIIYFHYEWEEKGRLFKLFSYIPKFISTMWLLIKKKPERVFVQLAPTPLLYTAALYKLMYRVMIVADCHNTMIYDDHWIKWPFAKQLLRWSDISLVHNDDVLNIAQQLHIDTHILRDPLPVLDVPKHIDVVAGIRLMEQAYVIIPCGIGADEPVKAMFEAIATIPDVLFAMTWFAEKLPTEVRTQAPHNLIFTGFLEEPEFNALYAKARAALVLTTREGTQPSGAAEAISLGVPLIVSELATTQRLYGDAPVFVENNAESITAGIRKALEEHDQLSKAVIGLRRSLVEDANTQIERIKAKLKMTA